MGKKRNTYFCEWARGESSQKDKTQKKEMKNIKKKTTEINK